MGLGILESKALKDVPGTARLEDHLSAGAGRLDVSLDNANLKRDAKGIILIPQPSDDPNDPLNWPLWRRDCITGLLCLLSVIASTLSPLLAANSLTFLLYYGNITITDVALLTGYHLLGVAIAGFLFVATARVYGKRHTFIIGAVVIILSCIWGGLSGKNYQSMVAARFFQGIGLAPFEACVNVAVGDMYPIHQRGKRMALASTSLFGASFATPIIVGVVTHQIGWQWVYYFVAIFAAAVLPLVYFFCPETSYVRDANLNNIALGQHATTSQQKIVEAERISNSSHDDGHGLTAAKIAETSSKQIEDVSQVSLTFNDDIYRPDKEAASARSTIPWVSKKSLKLVNGRYTDESFFKILFRPVPLFLHPGILMPCIIQSSLIIWTVMIGVILALVMLAPPLNFNEVQVGYMYTGAFLGALLGFLASGLLTDWTTTWLSKRNGGIFEPEFRFVLCIPQLIIGTIGLFGFGFSSADTYKYGWIWPDFFFGCVTFAMVFGAVASALYITDAYAELEVEGFTCLLITKNICCFGLTYKAFDWYLENGIYKLMYTAGSVQIVLMALVIPIYIYGKRVRSFFHRHDLLLALHLR